MEALLILYQCWLGDDVVPLADLRTEDDDVQSIFNDWISGLVSQYNSKHPGVHVRDQFGLIFSSRRS